MTKKAYLYSDGAARGNPGPAGIGGVVTDDDGTRLITISEYIGEKTNNAAEYTALIVALEKISEKDEYELEINSDSELMVNQLNGIYKVKNQGLSPLYNRVKNLLTSFSAVSVNHVPREENSEADKLANEAIDKFLSGDAEIYDVGGLGGQTSLF